MLKPTLLLTIACLWCAAGLIALDFSILIPSILTPYLSAIHDPVVFSTKAGLLSIAPVVHIFGSLFVKNYKIWDPMNGGTTFVYLQTTGWCIYATVCGLVLVELSQFCLTCRPGYLTVFALLLVIANSLLITSVESKHRTNVTPVSTALYSEVLTIVIGVSGVIYTVLNSHPLLVHTSSMFEGTELPFCETPYHFSKSIAQLPSAILHLPYIPFLLLLVYIHKPQWVQTGHEQIQILVSTFVFQWWTAVGHIVPNPRILLVQEIAIVLSLVILRAFVNSMTPDDKCKLGIGTFTKMLVLTLSSYSIFGLMPTIVGLTLLYSLCLGLMFNAREFCSAGGMRKSLKNTIRSTMPELSDRAKLTIGVTLIFTVTILLMEVQLCQLLLAYDSGISWHAPFDLMFWQCFWPMIQFATLSKPGSFWRKKIKI